MKIAAGYDRNPCLTEVVAQFTIDRKNKGGFSKRPDLNKPLRVSKPQKALDTGKGQLTH